MALYGIIWASSVYDAWVNSNPRVKLAVTAFAGYFREYGVELPEEYVKRQCIWHIRRKENQSAWHEIKASIEDETSWRTICRERLTAPWIDTSEPLETT